MITPEDIDRILDAIEVEVLAQWDYGMMPSREDLKTALVAKLITSPCPALTPIECNDHPCSTHAPATVYAHQPGDGGLGTAMFGG